MGARVLIDNGSQNIYAVQQLAGILLFVIAAEVVLATRVVGTDAIEHLPVAPMSPTLLSFDHEQTPFSAETGQKSVTARTCTCDPSLTSKTCNPLQDVCQPAGLQRQSDGLHPKPECK